MPGSPGLPRRRKPRPRRVRVRVRASRWWLISTLRFRRCVRCNPRRLGVATAPGRPCRSAERPGRARIPRDSTPSGRARGSAWARVVSRVSFANRARRSPSRAGRRSASGSVLGASGAPLPRPVPRLEPARARGAPPRPRRRPAAAASARSPPFGARRRRRFRADHPPRAARASVARDRPRRSPGPRPGPRRRFPPFRTRTRWRLARRRRALAPRVVGVSRTRRARLQFRARTHLHGGRAPPHGG